MSKIGKVLLIVMLLLVGTGTNGKPLKDILKRPARTGQTTTAAADSSGAGSATGPAVATINGEAISRREFLDVLYASGGLRVLRQLLAVTAARQLALKQGIVPTEADFTDRRKAIVAELTAPTDAGNKAMTDDQRQRILRIILDRRGMSLEEFELGVKCQTYLHALADREISVTDQNLRDEYHRVYGPRRRISVIIVEDRQLAQQIHADLQAGASFGELARTHSIDLTTGPIGGRLGTVSRLDKTLPDVVLELAFHLAEGKTSTPIKVDQQYWLIRIDKVIAAQPIEFNKVKADLRKQLSERLRRRLMENLQREVLLSSKIQVHDPGLDRRLRDWLDNLKQSTR